MWNLVWHCQSPSAAAIVFISFLVIRALYIYGRLSLCKSILKKIRFGSLQTSIRRHPMVSGRPNGESARARLYSW
jgi:hypothetical protein